jgi:hypothetical protein
MFGDPLSKAIHPCIKRLREAACLWAASQIPEEQYAYIIEYTGMFVSPHRRI